VVRYITKVPALAAAAVAVAPVVPMSSPAFALATAYNLRTEFLTNNPYADLPQSCVSPSIFLAAGNYEWELYPQPSGPTVPPTTRSIYP
jgi:hypothetical protein